METALAIYTDPNAAKRKLIPVILEPVEAERIRLSIRGKITADLTDPETRDKEFISLWRDLKLPEGRIPPPPPWPKTRKSKRYWRNLQRVVNHARTFVFPQFQGRGIGIRAHALLLTEGVRMWDLKYRDKVYALDTLCTADESKLFLSNGWSRAGQTKGYTLDRSEVFSRALKVIDDRKGGIKNNGALRKGEDSIQWWVWAIQLKAF